MLPFRNRSRRGAGRPPYFARRWSALGALALGTSVVSVAPASPATGASGPSNETPVEYIATIQETLKVSDVLKQAAQYSSGVETQVPYTDTFQTNYSYTAVLTNTFTPEVDGGYDQAVRYSSTSSGSTVIHQGSDDYNLDCTFSSAPARDLSLSSFGQLPPDTQEPYSYQDYDFAPEAPPYGIVRGKGCEPSVSDDLLEIDSSGNLVTPVQSVLGTLAVYHVPPATTCHTITSNCGTSVPDTQLKKGTVTNRWSFSTPGSYSDPAHGTSESGNYRDVGSTSVQRIGTCSIDGSSDGPSTGSFYAAGAVHASRSSCQSYVALGDSFSSGQTGGTAPCFRSSSAYPIVYDPQAIFEACSGATTADITAHQLGPLNRHTGVVSLTAGGDDGQLFQVVVSCVVNGRTPGACRKRLDKSLGSPTTSMSKIQSNVVNLLNKIRTRAPKAKVYILGYPDPVPKLVPRLCVLPLRLWITGGLFGLRQEDAELFYDVIGKLDAAVRAAANKTGAHYVPPFTGHNICSQDPWFYPLSYSELTLHPTPAGQKAMAAALRKAAGPPPS